MFPERIGTDGLLNMAPHLKPLLDKMVKAARLQWHVSYMFHFVYMHLHVPLSPYLVMAVDSVRVRILKLTWYLKLPGVVAILSGPAPAM